MNAERFLEIARERGLEVAARGGGVALRGPKGEITPALVEMARELRVELLALLAPAPAEETIESWADLPAEQRRASLAAAEELSPPRGGDR